MKNTLSIVLIMHRLNPSQSMWLFPWFTNSDLIRTKWNGISHSLIKGESVWERGDYWSWPWRFHCPRWGRARPCLYRTWERSLRAVSAVSVTPFSPSFQAFDSENFDEGKDSSFYSTVKKKYLNVRVRV